MVFKTLRLRFQGMLSAKDNLLMPCLSEFPTLGKSGYVSSFNYETLAFLKYHKFTILRLRDLRILRMSFFQPGAI